MVGTLLLITIIILLGVGSRRFGVFKKKDSKVLSSFVYYFALPALILVKIAQTDFYTYDLWILAAVSVPVFLSFGIFLLLFSLRIIKKEHFILLGLSVVFGSNTFFGVPFFESLFGETGLDFAVVTGAPLGLIGISLSLLLFEYATHTGKGSVFLKKIILNPVILSLAAGLFFSLTRTHITFLKQSLLLIGKTAGPVALFTLGMFVYDHFSLDVLKKSIMYAVSRYIILPVCTLVILLIIPTINNQLRLMILLQSGIPAAVSLAIFSHRYSWNEEKVTGMVVFTTILSLGILPLISVVGNVVF